MAEQDLAATQRPRIVVVGAGFGGLQAARALADAPVDILLLDRNNYHGFWPLLYQVATSQLEPQQIAAPVRSLIRGKSNIRFQMASVKGIDRERREVMTDTCTFPYDELIVSAGSATNFFGLDKVKAKSFDLKDVPEALTIRNHIIACFERAVTVEDPQEREQLLTFVIVGGGPTGVELAGAMAELINHVMRKDYPTLDFSKIRIVLIEAMERVLLPFAPSLSKKAQRKLAQLGVELRFNTTVVDFENQELKFKDGTTLPTETVIWAAGVQGAPLGKTLGVELQRGARVPVTPQLHLENDPHVWVIGDLAYLEDPNGKPYPQLATVAIQQGRHAARNLVRRMRGEPLRPFRYTDKGSMATVGRQHAVAQIWNLRIHGTLAWWMWLAVHLFYLIGFRNRMLVLFNWAYSYVTHDRGSRALVAQAPLPEADPETAAESAQPETLMEHHAAAR